MRNYTCTWSVPNGEYLFGSYHYETTTTDDCVTTYTSTSSNEYYSITLDYEDGNFSQSKK